MDRLVRPLKSVDWTSADEIELASKSVLTRIMADTAVLEDALLAVPDRPELADLCEHYDILDKIVLYDEPELGIRVRMHVFLPGYFDRPHNHRWSYSSLILTGRYRHVLYGTDEGLDESTDARNLRPLMVRDEREGALYTLHHSMVHAVTAEPFTASLVIRGPAVKDRFLVMDRVTGQSWWQYGAKQESRAQSQAKRMPESRLREMTALVLGRVLRGPHVKARIGGGESFDVGS